MHMLYASRWRQQIETFSALLAICAGNSFTGIHRIYELLNLGEKSIEKIFLKRAQQDKLYLSPWYWMVMICIQ